MVAVIDQMTIETQCRMMDRRQFWPWADSQGIPAPTSSSKNFGELLNLPKLQFTHLPNGVRLSTFKSC